MIAQGPSSTTRRMLPLQRLWPGFTGLVGLCLPALLFLGCEAPLASDARSLAIDQTKQQVISGTDDRHEPFEYADQAWAARARTFTVALMPRAAALAGGNEDPLAAFPDTLREKDELCSDEAFASQPSAALCSGALIAEDLVLTAGHCVADLATCQNTAFVFGFEMLEAGSQAPIPRANVFGCAELLARGFSRLNTDFALVRLDRPATGRAPAAIVRDGRRLQVGDALTVAGHPSGLPLKLTSDGEVLVPGSPYTQAAAYGFAHSLDIFGGNSGSGTFLDVRGEKPLAGIVSSQQDVSEKCWDALDGCYRLIHHTSSPQAFSMYAGAAISALCAIPAHAARYPTLCACGNGACDAAGGETALTCATDCSANCGDGICERDETPTLCAADCGTCGNRTCDGASDCCADCGCGTGETCSAADGCVLSLSEVGGSCQTPSELTVSPRVALRLPRAQQAYFRFRLTTPKRVSVERSGVGISVLDASCQNTLGNAYDVIPAGEHVLSLRSDSRADVIVLFAEPDEPEGVRCAAPIEIEPNTQVLVGDTTAGLRIGCSPYQCEGNNIHYRFTVTERRALSVNAAAFPGAALVLRSTNCQGQVLRLSVDRARSGEASLRYIVEPGSYYLTVSAEQVHDFGAYSLNLSFAEPVDLQGDSCFDAAPLTPVGHQVVTGELAGATNDYQAGDLSYVPWRQICPFEMYGKDRVYRFEIENTTRVQALLSASFPAVVHINDAAESCASVPLVCAQGAQRLDRVLSAGAYYVWVDARAEWQSGDYELTLDFESEPSPRGETCDDAIPLPASGLQVRSGDLRGSSPDHVVDCGDAIADHVYGFELTETRTVDIQVTGADVRYALAEGDCYSGARPSCRSAHNQTLAPGRYFIIVQSLSSPGPYELSVNFDSAPRGESCDDAVSLRVDTPSTLETSSLPSKVYGGDCATRHEYGRYFSVELTERMLANLSVTSLANVGLSLTRGNDDRVCADENDHLERVLMPGRYCGFVGADGPNQAFELTAAFQTDDRTLGLSCDDALPLAAPGVHHLNGTTVDAFADVPCFNNSRPDRIYTFELTETSKVEIQVSEGHDLVLFKDSCSAPTRVLGCGAVRTYLSEPYLAPGRYYLSVRAPSTPWTYTLDVSISCDQDGDGVCNASDGCPYDGNKSAPGQCGCHVADTDRDQDTIADCHDGCPRDPTKQSSGACGCGVSDADSDADGTPNCVDGCPANPLKQAPGTCGCLMLDTFNCLPPDLSSDAGSDAGADAGRDGDAGRDAAADASSTAPADAAIDAASGSMADSGAEHERDAGGAHGRDAGNPEVDGGHDAGHPRPGDAGPEMMRDADVDPRPEGSLDGSAIGREAGTPGSTPGDAPDATGIDSPRGPDLSPATDSDRDHSGGCSVGTGSKRVGPSLLPIWLGTLLLGVRARRRRSR